VRRALTDVPSAGRGERDWSIEGLAPRIESLEGRLNGAGRILLRYSGTELLARVMVEGQEQAEIEKIAHELAGIIRQAIGQ